MLAHPLPRRSLALGAAGLALSACTSSAVRLRHIDGSAGRGFVLLLRGIGNVFSRGLDRLAQRVAAAGYDAEVHNHSAWRSLVPRLIGEHRSGRLPRPFAIIGHSLGADDAILLAGALGEAGVATDLVVTFDPTWVDEVPRGPRRLVNFYQLADVWGDPVSPGPGFDGEMTNVNVTDGTRIDHFTIHSDPALHARAIALLNALHAPVVSAGAPGRGAAMPPPRPMVR